MRQHTTHLDALTLPGDRPCLDFVHTAEWRETATPEEYLTTYADLVEWSQRAELVREGEANRLLAAAALRPVDAAAVLGRAIALREAMYRIVLAATQEHPAEPADLATLNGALAGALIHLRIVPAGAAYTWAWAGDNDALDRMLWPVVRSAADLLASEELRHVRKCAGEGCGWLFLDTSKNQSRRWCTMETCGNRAKARRHYQRTRRAGAPNA